MIQSQALNASSNYSPIAIPQPVKAGASLGPSANAPFLAAVTLCGALIAGTGGIYAASNVAQVRDRPAVEIRATGKEEKDQVSYAPSVDQHLRQFRDGFGLKMSEVAQIFGVSRQAAYAWLDGTTPKPECIAKIWKLSKSVEELRAGGIERLDLFVHRPLLRDGRSLFDLLISGDQIDEAIAVIKETADREARLRAEAPTRHSGTFNEKNSSLAELVKPILEEHRH